MKRRVVVARSEALRPGRVLRHHLLYIVRSHPLSFRNSYNPRVVVTEAIIAAGADLKPLERLFLFTGQCFQDGPVILDGPWSARAESLHLASMVEPPFTPPAPGAHQGVGGRGAPLNSEHSVAAGLATGQCERSQKLLTNGVS